MHRRFLRLFKPHYKQGLGIFLIIMISAGFTVGSPFLYKEMVDDGILKGNVSLLFIMLAGILVIMVLQEVLYLLRTALTIRIRQAVFAGLRINLYQHLMRMPQRFYLSNHRGRLLSRMTSDVDAVQNLMLEQYIYFAQSLLVGLGIFSIILSISTTMILVTCAALPLLYFFYMLFRKRISELSREVQEKQESMTERLQEDLSKVKAIQSYPDSGDRMQQTRNLMRDTELARGRLSRVYATASASTTTINLIGMIVIWGIGGLEVTNGKISLGTLIAISFYLNYMISLYFNAYYAVIGFQRSRPAAERIFEVLDAPQEIADGPDSREPDDFAGDLAFENVTFAYEKDRPVISEAGFVLNRGDWVGVVGDSGEGKTTLANLMVRFYDPDIGRVTLNGADLRSIRLASLRKNTAIVPQEDDLFNVSIRENILMGRQHISEERFRLACERAGLRFVDNLSEGWDTVVGENGMRLSGGQRKRISLARAILDNPYILILDEATAGLDETTEQDILRSVRSIADDRITIMITHKSSNLQFSNKILRVDKGKVDFIRSLEDDRRQVGHKV